jgi:hypothetical protein
MKGCYEKYEVSGCSLLQMELKPDIPPKVEVRLLKRIIR